ITGREEPAQAEQHQHQQGSGSNLQPPVATSATLLLPQDVSQTGDAHSNLTSLSKMDPSTKWSVLAPSAFSASRPNCSTSAATSSASCAVWKGMPQAASSSPF